jgi:hypothetical protein
LPDFRVADGGTFAKSIFFNVIIALALVCLGVLTVPASAQAPPCNLGTSSVWSSKSGALYALDLLMSHTFDEVMLMRSSIPIL